MRRQASVFHLGRTNIDSLVRRLRIQDVSAWPPHLRRAFALLTEKLRSQPPVARQVVISASRAAHACAVAISNVALQEERQLARDRCGRCFRMLANNLRLLPAKLRKTASDGSARRLGTADFDPDVLEEILDGLVRQLRSVPTDRAAKSALKAIYAGGAVECGNRFGLVDLYGSLEPTERCAIESSVQKWLLSTSNSVSAEELFVFLAKALGEISISKPGAVAAAIVEYVECVGKLWLDNRLPATRAFHPENPHYKSSFHIFSDMVLAAATEPSTSRHETDLELIRSRTLHQHRLLPAALRPDVSAASRRQDNEWLVSDDHVRRAISKLKGNSKVGFEK